MSKNRFVFLIGIYLLLFPFLGFPSSWENFFSIIFGLVLIGLSLSVSLKRRTTRKVIRRQVKNINLAQEVVTKPVDVLSSAEAQELVVEVKDKAITQAQEENNQA